MRSRTFGGPKRSGGFEARYRHKVPLRRVQIVLVLEITTSWWPTKLIDRDTQAACGNTYHDCRQSRDPASLAFTAIHFA
jgi:hypothetical protein